MTVTELAAATSTDKALISRTLRELIDDGFIATKTPGEDRTYKKKYYLTPRSEEIVDAINKDIAAYILSARGDMPDDDIATFYRVLATFEKNISLIAGGKHN